MEKDQEQITFQVREEKLDIKKDWVQIGEVNCHKEIQTEQKTITVPILHEELIIEKKFIDKESPGQFRTVIIRVPIREERVEIKKHAYDLEKVEVYKRQLHQTETVNAVLKKERVNLKTTGDVDLELL